MPNEKPENDPPELHKRVVDFYNSDHVSWQMPGQKDNKIMKDGTKNEGSEKKSCLVQFLKLSKNLKENPVVKIGKSTFAALRPAHIVPVSEKDHAVCCCKYHENFELLCSGLRKLKPDLPDEKSFT